MVSNNTITTRIPAVNAKVCGGNILQQAVKVKLIPVKANPPVKKVPNVKVMRSVIIINQKER